MRYEVDSRPEVEGRLVVARLHATALPRPITNIYGCTEAEAHIIVFALNAVAEGKHLYVVPVEFIVEYEGPTEGVAPA